jgi:hypothetical protein
MLRPIDRRRDSHRVTDRYIVITGTLSATQTKGREFGRRIVAAGSNRRARHMTRISKRAVFGKLD